MLMLLSLSSSGGGVAFLWSMVARGEVMVTECNQFKDEGMSFCAVSERCVSS